MPGPLGSRKPQKSHEGQVDGGGGEGVGSDGEWGQKMLRDN